MKPWSRKDKSGSAPDVPLHCSFCNKSQRQVKKLIAGPRVFICEECVNICNDILAEDRASSAEPQPSPTPVPASAVVCCLCKLSLPADEAILVAERGFVCTACCAAVVEAQRDSGSAGSS
jgi:hypothetical protein